MDGHVIKVVHGYGGTPLIVLDGMQLKNVKSYVVKGEGGKLPELTVTLSATSVSLIEEEPT